MALGIGRLFLRGRVFHGMVREELQGLRHLHGDRAHAVVVEKLGRSDLTARYRGVLQEVERRLRPSRLGVVMRAARPPAG